MEEYAGLLAYLWFTLGNLGSLFTVVMLICIMSVLSWFVTNTVFTNGVAWMFINKDKIDETSYYKIELEKVTKFSSLMI